MNERALDDPIRPQKTTRSGARQPRRPRFSDSPHRAANLNRVHPIATEHRYFRHHMQLIGQCWANIGRTCTGGCRTMNIEVWRPSAACGGTQRGVLAPGGRCLFRRDGVKRAVGREVVETGPRPPHQSRCPKPRAAWRLRSSGPAPRGALGRPLGRPLHPPSPKMGVVRGRHRCWSRREFARK